MRSIPTTLLLTCLIFVCPRQTVAQSSATTDCSTPSTNTEPGLTHDIQVACLVARSGVESGYLSIQLRDRVDLSIERIGMLLEKPDAFDKCWTESRFVCYGVKRAINDLADLVAAPDVEGFSPVALETDKAAWLANALTRLSRAARTVDAFCHDLRR